MPNIKIELSTPIINGQTLVFKSPADSTKVSGLTISYQDNGSTNIKTFEFADAHGQNVGNTNLFSGNVLVKVILDTELDRAYVQNADTNAYLEAMFAQKLSVKDGVVTDPIVLKKGVHYGDSYPTNAVLGQLFLISLGAVNE